MGIVDTSSGEEFLMERYGEEAAGKSYTAVWSKAITEQMHVVAEEIRQVEGVTVTTTTLSQPFETPRNLGTHTYELWGSGGTETVQVAPYREGGFNQTTQTARKMYEYTCNECGNAYSTGKLRDNCTHYSQASIRTPLEPLYTDHLMYVPVGCFFCDKIMQCENENPLAEYNNWYKHYVDYQTQADDEVPEQSTVAHLDFIKTHMMKCVYYGMDSSMWVEHNPVWPIPAPGTVVVKESAPVKVKRSFSSTDTAFDKIMLTAVVPGFAGMVAAFFSALIVFSYPNSLSPHYDNTEGIIACLIVALIAIAVTLGINLKNNWRKR